MEERQLNAMHPSLVSTWDSANSKWDALNGWEMVNPGGACVHETVIDLSGFAMESLTFFPQAVGLQDPGIYAFSPLVDPALPQVGLIMLDIITSVPMDVATVAAVAAPFPNNSGPGMLGSLYEFETILFGMYRFFTQNTNVPYPNYLQLERSQRFDSGQPNAADKLYCYRIAITLQQDLVDGNSLTIPAARQLIGGAMDAESELVYMQRLKRSYELATQV